MDHRSLKDIYFGKTSERGITTNNNKLLEIS